MNSGRLAALEQRWWATLRPKPDPFESKGGGGRGEKGNNEKKALIRRSSRGDFRLEIDLAATFENILDQRWDQV